MKTSIVLTIIADDRPGIINAVSKVLIDHGGGWTKSSMSSLAGKFAGILLASVPSKSADQCIEDLRELESNGLKVIAHVSQDPVAKPEMLEYTLNLIGNDRDGIVHDVSTILAKHNVNVNQLDAFAESASMGGADVFRAKAELEIPSETDLGELELELESIANELMVDIVLKQ